MKSLKDYSLNLPEKEYHAYPAWSYSMISRYAKDGFAAIKTIHDPVAPSPSMEFGSLVDCLMTEGDFDKQYVVTDSCPPPAEKNVLDKLLTMTNVPFYDIPTSTMEDAIAQCEYHSNWKYPTQYQHIEEVSYYYENKREGKKMVSTVDYNDAVDIASALHSSEYYSGKIFKPSGVRNGIEYIYQAQFLVEYETNFSGKVNIKIMPDLLIVNHNVKQILPVDLKTSSMPGYDFTENFVKFHYHLQASLYTDVLRMILDKDDDYKNYTILPYIFTDISRVDKIPVSWTYDPNDPDQIDGFQFKDYQYKNWRALLEEILLYEKSDAVVPDWIKLDKPNNIVDVLNRR